MTRVSIGVWLFSFAIALVIHGAAILLFAALLNHPPEISQSQIHLATTTDFPSTVMAETVSEKSVAANSELEDSAIKPVSSTADVLTEFDGEATIATQHVSPVISEQTNSIVAESEVTTFSPAGHSPESPKIVPELADARETTPSDTSHSKSTDVINAEVNAETTLSEVVIGSPPENAQTTSGIVSELAEMPTSDNRSGSTVTESTQQSDEISTIGNESEPSDNASAAARNLALEMPNVREPSAKTGASAAMQETSSSPGGTLNDIAENDAPPEQLALVVPREPPDKRLKQPDPSKAADIKSLIGDFDGGPCFLSVPIKDQGNEWFVRSYGAERASFGLFTEHLEKTGAVDVTLEKRSIQNLQCGAISFAKTFASITNDRFKITVRNSMVPDGGDLDFLVSGFDQEWLYITMIDDDGVATDISSYAKLVGPDVRLTMPVHVKNEGKYRSQLLLAIASDQPLTLLDMPAPRPFAEVLPLIKGTIIAADAKVEIAISDFSVE